MNILFIGDVVGTPGCEFLRKALPMLKKENKIDLCIVNGENSAEGNGILKNSAESIFASGADVITGGNHTLRRKEFYPTLEENEYLLRPANYPKEAPGHGMCIVDLGFTSVAVINIIGTVYMESMESPFDTADRLIENAKEKGIKNIFVDFHAEATSEKRALGFYLDSRVTAVVGTHTHIQTNDAEILPGGTAYLTDAGMTGIKNSVLGVKTELAIKKMKDKLPVRFCNEQEGAAMLNGCIITVDRALGLAESIKTINITEREK